ncbi:MAG: agmatine deiminase family protein [Nanoarchaeota archaeon]
MIPDNETNTVYFSDKLSRKYPEIYESMTIILSSHNISFGIIEHTKDIWVRDFMPIQIDNESFVIFRYMPDYLVGYDHLITPKHHILRSIINKGEIVHSDLVIDGGNVVPLGKNRVAMTEKIFKENPDYGYQELIIKLENILKSQIIILPHEPEDIIGHADGLIRYIKDNTVLINNYIINQEYHERLVQALEKQKLNIEILPFACPYTHSLCLNSIPSAEGLYLNFLRIGNLIILPIFNLEEDILAIEKMRQLYPNQNIETVIANKLARQGGVFNCISWNIKEDSPKIEEEI